MCLPATLRFIHQIGQANEKTCNLVSYKLRLILYTLGHMSAYVCVCVSTHVYVNIYILRARYVRT